MDTEVKLEATKENTTKWQENISLGKKLIIAFQHVLTMCPATIAVPLILGNALELDSSTIAFLVSANLFTSGIAVLIQVVGLGKSIGSKLPIVLGSSFAPLGPMIMIGQEFGLAAVFGSVLASGVIMFALSFVMDKILKLFPDVVVGSFVTLIGVSLAPTAIRDLAGGVGSENFGMIQNLLLGLFVVLVITLIERYGKGLLQSLSLLVGMGVGSAIALGLGMIDLSTIANAKVFELVTPFKFGMPEFRLGSIVIMTIFSIINVIQCIGVFSVLDEVVETETDDKTKVSGIRALTISQVISGVFNSVPSTMFNENVGLINLTKIKDKSVISMTGVMLILLGIFPKISALLTAIPKPVIGGATLVLFGIITSAGISILSNLDFSKNNNFTIMGTSLAIGVGVTFAPEIFQQLPQTLEMLFSNGLFMASITGIVLNLLLNRSKEKFS